MKKKELQAQIDELRKQNQEIMRLLLEEMNRPREPQFFGPRWEIPQQSPTTPYTPWYECRRSPVPEGETVLF